MAATSSIPTTTGRMAAITKRAHMPSLTEKHMPTFSSESYSYSIGVPNSQPTAVLNPYIHHSSLPNNLVFIIVGAIILAMLVAFALYRVISSFTGRRLAKSDKEVYYSNPSSLYHFGGTSSSNSSFFEKASMASTASINQLSKHGSVVWLTYRDLDSSSNDSSTPGHQYRQAITGKEAPRRNSLFISPVLDIMNKRNSQLELPLFHDSSMGLNLSFVNGSDVDVSTSRVDVSDRMSRIDVDRMSRIDVDRMSRNDVDRMSRLDAERPVLKRPPSEYLEDLFK